MKTCTFIVTVVQLAGMIPGVLLPGAQHRFVLLKCILAGQGVRHLGQDGKRIGKAGVWLYMWQNSNVPKADRYASKTRDI